MTKKPKLRNGARVTYATTNGFYSQKYEGVIESTNGRRRYAIVRFDGADAPEKIEKFYLVPVETN